VALEDDGDRAVASNFDQGLAHVPRLQWGLRPQEAPPMKRLVLLAAVLTLSLASVTLGGRTAREL
jgi:hypothetical protein